MGRIVDVDDLIGSTDVAEMIGLSHVNSVTTYLKRYPDFPRPVVDVSNGRIRLWLRQDIDGWLASRSRVRPI